MSCKKDALVAVLALALPMTSCSVDVRHSPVETWVGLPPYPDARRVYVEYAADENVSFTGNFARTNVVGMTFGSDDSPEMILDFYRRVLGAYGPVVECRGTINVRRRRGVESLGCVEQSSSPTVQLAAGVHGKHSVVAVTMFGPTSQFDVLDVRTGW